MSKDIEARKLYKLVQIENGEYVSLVVCLPFELRYAIGKETKAKIGKIFTFLKFEQAQKFTYTFSDCNLAILEVKAQNIVKGDKMILSTRKDKIEKFWKEGVSQCNIEDVYNCAQGTMLCDSIIPIKEVWNSKMGNI